jgi:hypothetical protein
MYIRTRISGLGLSLEARVPTEDRPNPTLEIISLKLIPTDDHHRIDLDTGEVFQDYNYARVRGNEKKLIYASMTVRPCLGETDYQYNTMSYFDEQTGDDFHSPALIHVETFMEPTAFRQLVDNIRGGLLPSVVLIELPFRVLREKSPMEYSWEPDGSAVVWHNKEEQDRRIAVESVRFDYAVGKPHYDEKQMGPLPIQVDAPTERLSEQIAPIQASLNEMLKYLRWTTMGIVALAIMVAILFLKRGTL